MAERFGSQGHPSGGSRFGSQTYAALAGASVGVLAATESGADVFAAASLPRVTGAGSLAESGVDTIAVSGSSSRVFTVQATESPAPDAFHASGVVAVGSLRFGSQAHPLGGVRFGAQAWAALGPSTSLVAVESGADSVAAIGWLTGVGYSFRLFDILPSYVDYGPESLGAAITGTLDAGFKVMLPVDAAGGISFTWELNGASNPSLRLSNLAGATNLAAVPWYVWDGAAWASALFDVSDSMQGAAFMLESGADAFVGNGSQTRYGALALTEVDTDFLGADGRVLVRGTMIVTEQGGDQLASTGAPGYLGAMLATEAGADLLTAAGRVAVSGDALCVEAANSDVFAGAASLGASGSLAAAEAGTDSLHAAGRALVRGTLDATEPAGGDALVGSGAAIVLGSLGALESGSDSLAAVGSAARIGELSAVEAGADALAATGVIKVFGEVSATEQLLDVFAAAGQRESSGTVVAAELDAQEGGADRFVARGFVGSPPPVRTFNGPCKIWSRTRSIVINWRRNSKAA